MTGYVRKLECNSTMSFKISNKQLLKKYNQIWKSVEKLLKIEFDGKPVYGDDDKYIITKIKIYGVVWIQIFKTKEKAPSNCLSIIMLDSVIKTKKKYYSQTLLEECKHEQKWITIENLIDNNLEKVCLIVKPTMIIMMKRNLTMNLTSNLLKAKKVF